LKICDFGLSRVLYTEKFPIMTEYTCTRWFRAPEILLGLDYYDFRVDLWSAACIVAEMLTRKPLFPGQNTQHQLQLIVRVVGTPTKHPPGCETETAAAGLLGNLEIYSRRNFRTIFPTAAEDAVDLLEILLRFDFQERPTAAEALGHEFFGEFRDESDEPEGERIPEREFEFDERKLDLGGLRGEIFNEAAKYRTNRV
jgi:mitogen-activated protein kinase 1/3